MASLRLHKNNSLDKDKLLVNLKTTPSSHTALPDTQILFCCGLLAD